MTSSIIPLLRAAGVDCWTRRQWGSRQEAEGSYARRVHSHPMPPAPADYHFLHITVTADTDTVREGFAGAQQVESYGLSSPPMVSYQDLVTNEGRYFEGQSYGVKGTHTINDKRVAGYPYDLNLRGYAAAIMQNVDDAVTDAQVETLAKVYAARELLGLVRRGAPILPHRTFAWKSCPGDRAVARIDEIERLKNEYVRAGWLPGAEVKEWDDMATKDEIREAVAEAVAAQVKGNTLAIGKPEKGGRDTVTDDRFARMLLNTLDKVLSRVNRTNETLAQLTARVAELEAAVKKEG